MYIDSQGTGLRLNSVVMMMNDLVPSSRLSLPPFPPFKNYQYPKTSPTQGMVVNQEDSFINMSMPQNSISLLCQNARSHDAEW